MVAAVDGRASHIDEPGSKVSAEVQAAEAQAIEAFFRRRFGRDAVYLPSSGFGVEANSNCFIRDWTR
jgi:hypothetical protein